MRRLAQERDLEQIFTIYMHESVIPFLGYDPMPLDDFRRVYHDLLTSGGFYVYERAGEVAGFYNVSRHPGRARHVAVLGSLAVAPGFQGQGIGREMIRDAIDSLSGSGIKRIELIVESDNPRAIGFYEGLGFRIEGTLRNFYKRAHQSHYVDDHIMALLL